MPDNYYGPDDPTQQTPLHYYKQEPQEAQGKLILGSSPSTPHPPHTPRTPYQYQQQQVQTPYQPNTAQERKQHGAYANPPANAPTHKRGRRFKQKRARQIGCLSALLIVIILCVIIFSVGQHVLAFGNAISTQSPLSTQTNYMTTSDRTNLLIAGYGGVGHDGSYLTDSLVVISMIPSSQHTSVVSVPRDLWVSNPPGSSTYTKINAVYDVASDNNQNINQGGNVLAQKVSTITGLDVQHWMFIDFQGFQQFIDAIGGVDINVPDSFTSLYPANDDPAINASWITIHFNQGEQHMNGQTAIRYARAREVTDNPAEGTDFARSIRQQLIIKSALAKLQSISTWSRLYGALDALQQAIHTNFSLADLGLFAKKMNLDDPKTAHIGLNQSNVMTVGTASDGESIVYPLNWDWTIIPPYIKQNLYN